MPRDESRKTSIWISRAQKAWDLQENKRHITLHRSLFKGNKSLPGSKAMKPSSILGRSQAVRWIKSKHSWGAWKQNANTSAGVSLKISLSKQVLAQEQSPRHTSCVSGCQGPGRRAVLLLAGRWLTQEGASPGIPRCLLPALPARARNTCQRWQERFSLSVAEAGTQPY